MANDLHNNNALSLGAKGHLPSGYSEFIVGFETIRPANTHQANAGFF